MVQLKNVIDAYKKGTLWESTKWKFLKKFFSHKSIIVTTKSGAKLRIYMHDVIGAGIFINGAFEPESFNFISDYLKPGMVFFDLGANLGQYTVLAGQCVGEIGAVHSFEPCLRMFGELQFNVNLNNLQNICELNNVAVSDKQGVAFLKSYEPGAEVYSSIGEHKRTEANIVGQEEVKTVTIDDYCKIHNIKHIDFMKIDIEGAELLALNGAKQILSKPDAPMILMEFADVNTQGFGYKAVDIWDFLSQFGYKMYYINMETAKRPADFSTPQDLIAGKS